MGRVGAVVALLALVACAGPVPERRAPGAASVTVEAGGTVAAEPCVAPADAADAADAADEIGTRVELADGRAPDAVGIRGPVRTVEVVDLGDAGRDAAALAAALAAVLDPCGEDGPVVATGDRVVPELLARWGTDAVLMVEAEDLAARSALVAAAGTGAVPLVLPARPAPPAAEGAAEGDGSAVREGDAEAAPPVADPASELLALLPAGVVVTAAGSDATRAEAVAARLRAAGRSADGVLTLVDAGVPSGGPRTGGTLWIVDPADPARALLAAAAAAARGEAALLVDPSDAVEVLRHADALRAAAPERLLLVGDGTGGAAVAWHLDVALHVDPLPWGGWLPLDGTRIVAVYGSPGAPTLGVLGQQDLDATFDRVRALAAPYAVDGLRVVPGLDMIATVATAVAGPRDDYSRRVPISTLRPYVDRAREEGAAVFIDLQPGRTDFLTQAKEYEELLLEPHVFLALDPEWRLRPDQVHLRQIGSVEAAEVQAVADWLAELVRRERLPQKVLMLHQFLLTMLPDRDTVVVPPELVGVVHVDGQGPVATKQRTFRIMAEESHPQWRWGWKQFLRIDTPRVMDPADVIARDPVPVVITYQ